MWYGIELKTMRRISGRFFKAFHMVRPTKTLLLIKEKIEQEQEHLADTRTIILKSNEPDGNVSDDILQILGSFENHDDLPTALELLLLYYKKRPDLYKQFFNTLAGRFEVDIDSCRFGYYTQNTVIEHLCAAIDENEDDINLLNLFVHVAGHFLKLSLSKVKGGRHNAVSFYTFALPPDKPVLEYRKKLFSKIYQIYCWGKMHAEIEQILDKYGMPFYGADTNLGVVRAELGEVLNFFPLFQEENLYHCIIAQHIEKVAKHVGCDASDTIEQYSVDEDRMYELFSAIEELPQERRKRAVEKFLSLNADPDVFEKLPLESSSWGGSGSMIPYMQARVDYLSSLLPSVSGLKYLQQKQRIKRDIENWKARIRAEEIEELLVDWYR